MNTYKTNLTANNVTPNQLKAFATEHKLKLTIERGNFGLDNGNSCAAWNLEDSTNITIFADSPDSMIKLKLILNHLPQTQAG